MKKLMIVFILTLLTHVILFAQDSQQEEKACIKKVIQTAYVDGLCNNYNKEAVLQGFHPGFDLLSIGNGNTMWKLPIYNWIESAKKGKEKGYKYSFQDELTTVKYLLIDITGDVAIAKIEFYEGKDMNYIDYLSLMKFEGSWKIVGKMFHHIKKEEG